MAVEYFNWNANPFSKLFQNMTSTATDFLDVCDENTRINKDGYCCIDSLIDIGQCLYRASVKKKS